MIGTTVGKYRISEKLGRGGMGTVYKAVDATLDREVAVKVLNSDLTEPDLLKRFRAEAVTLARLNHPGIATLYELHHHDDELVMVMEFVRGETFHDLADRLGPLAPPQAAHLCMQVLDALGHAHRAGVVHRDLKPANLMITEGGTVKVMDFGIARVLGSEHFTHGGYMMGTPAYMAPEQVLGREIDGRADLYSVGVVFYRLLSGQLPFKAETAISMVQKQISDAPTPIATFRPDLPDWCTAVIDRALAKSPSDRFQSAEEFRSALVRAVTPQTLGELPTLSTPTPAGIVLEPDQTMPHGTPVPPLPSTLISTPGVAIQTPATPVASGPVLTPVAVQPTPTAGTERTTTVVLGRTHLAAMAALFVILAAGIAMLAFAALRRGSNQQPITTQASQSVPSVPSQSVSFPPAPAPVPPPAPAEPPASTPPASSAPVPSTNPPTKPLPPAAGGVATVGAVPAPVKPKTMKPGASTDVTTPPTDAAGARGGPAAGANASSPAPPAPATPPPPSAAPTVEQPVIFGQVRVLVTDGGKSREQAGSLRLGDGRVAVLTAGGGSVVSLPISSLTRVVYARSKQPKWRDANGKEVESRIDFGPMGFFRGERNWLMFFAGGEPTILRVEDSALRTVLPAIETHTGLTIQR